MLSRMGLLALLALWLPSAAWADACPPLVQSPTAATSAPAVDRGLLWRATRGGHSSYLYGTLHVGKPTWTPGPLTAKALAASDVLALEIDPNDPALTAALSQAQAQPQDLSPATAERLQRAFDRACLSRAALSGLNPVLQATTLVVLEARWLGLDPQYAQEQLLLPLARSGGLEVKALETPAQQLAVLMPNDPAATEGAVVPMLQQLEDGSGRRVLQRLSQAWLAGDLAGIEDFEQWCECVTTEADRAELRRLNDARNPALADGIEALHMKGVMGVNGMKGQRVFAAVGALHMTGPQSLPRLLMQRGFVVERIRFGR